MIVATGDRSTPGSIYMPLARLPGMVQPCRAHYIEGQHVAIIFGVFTDRTPGFGYDPRDSSVNRNVSPHICGKDTLTRVT